MTEHGLNLGAGKDHRDVAVALGANHSIEFAEFPTQDVAVKLGVLQHHLVQFFMFCARSKPPNWILPKATF